MKQQVQETGVKSCYCTCLKNNKIMIQKEVIREDGFNRAIINSMYENGDVVVTLQEVTTDEEGNETIVKEDHNIVLPAGTIELTAKELEELNPQPVTEQTEI